MVLEIADNIVKSSQMTEAEIRLELAVLLFDKNRLTFGQAFELAGISDEIFAEILSERKILRTNVLKPAQKHTPLSLNIEKFPKNIADFAIQPAQFASIAALFEDAPSAEELCRML